MNDSNENLKYNFKFDIKELLNWFGLFIIKTIVYIFFTMLLWNHCIVQVFDTAPVDFYQAFVVYGCFVIVSRFKL